MIEIASAENKKRIGLIVVGYNRLESMARLLRSLLEAEYDAMNVPLVISIDCSDNQPLYQYVESFEWPYGEKYVFIRQTKLGLKEHILQCGDLTTYFKAIILLEDDLYVSKEFYRYACAAINIYKDEEKIAGISLYKNEMNGYVGFPFVPVNNGIDVFAIQAVSTWGECWTQRMWSGFRKWYASGEVDFVSLEMPCQIKSWREAWSKYFNAYMVLMDKFFVYPHISLTTNFNDAGVHGGAEAVAVQVQLLAGNRSWQMLPFSELVKYDIFLNRLGLETDLDLSKSELCIDLFGNNPNLAKRRYLLSVRKLNFPIVRTFALNLRPIEMNVIFRLQGEGIYLYDTNASEVDTRIQSGSNLAMYYLHGFNGTVLKKMALRLCRTDVTRKLKKVWRLFFRRKDVE